MLLQRLTGVLMPLFSLRREGDCGIGDMMALEEWIRWAGAHGVGFLQLLPVNALGEDDAPSPYSAISSVALVCRITSILSLAFTMASSTS